MGKCSKTKFETPKVEEAIASTLKVVDPSQPFRLETNTSDKTMDAMLSQGRLSIAFKNKKLNHA